MLQKEKGKCREKYFTRTMNNDVWEIKWQAQKKIIEFRFPKANDHIENPFNPLHSCRLN